MAVPEILARNNLLYLLHVINGETEAHRNYLTCPAGSQGNENLDLLTLR